MGKASDYLSDKVRSVARKHRYDDRQDNVGDSTGGSILPTYNKSVKPTNNEAGGLNEKHGSPSGSTTGGRHDGADGGGHNASGGGLRSSGPEEFTRNDIEDAISQNTPPPAPPPDKSEAASSGDPTIKSADGSNGKPPITKRMKAGSKRFLVHMKNAICHSWINVLLICVPVGIIVEAIGLSPAIVFAINAVAIVPLAGLLAHATESVAVRLGDTLGALLNVSFGNAVELIIFIIALVKNEIRIVQASLIGSILSNLLLILGMAFLLGGLRYREQIYNSTVTQMSACLLSLSVTSLLLPTAFHASFNEANVRDADQSVLQVSRGTSVILLIVYVLYLLFQLKSHAYMYESTPQQVIDEESHPGVLADMLGSSSSSSDTSSSSSSDTDTSGSVTTTKRFKRMIKRKRRKSSASASSVGTPSVPSAISSPSTEERTGSYWEPAPLKKTSRRGSALGAIASADEGDADVEDGHADGPRIRDFVTKSTGSKSPERKKRSKKHKKKHFKKHRHHHEEDDNNVEKPSATEDLQPASSNDNHLRVGFAEDVHDPAITDSPSKRAFNMRQLSSRTNPFRPALPKMLSNNVFVMPPPTATPVMPPVQPVRSRSAGGQRIRRTNSLPDRLNRQSTPSGSTPAPPTVVSRTDPLPPFQHQRSNLRMSSDLSDTVEDDEKPVMSRTAAVVMLLISTALVAVCAEFLVDAIPAMIADSPTVGEAFIGLIILPIVGNAAEHVTAVTVAAKNKMDLAIGVAVGSSIQIALFVTPIVVLLGWILERDMSLYFNLFETISLFVTAFVVNFLVLDGRSNYLEGSLLIAAYVIIALGAFFYPDAGAQSNVGGGVSDTVKMF